MPHKINVMTQTDLVMKIVGEVPRVGDFLEVLPPPWKKWEVVEVYRRYKPVDDDSLVAVEDGVDVVVKRA